jgi:pimeloyl-ACP methyl ester carboxylesterase
MLLRKTNDQESSAGKSVLVGEDRVLPSPRVGRATTDDGCELTYYLSGNLENPAIVFANGLGVDDSGSRVQRDALEKDYCFISWDYRGVGESRVPSPEVDVSMARQARDALTVLDALEIERAVFVGWSMGVQVSLEVHRLAPHRVAGLVALLGTFGRPLDAYPKLIGQVIQSVFVFGTKAPTLAQKVIDLAVALPGVTHFLGSWIGFVGRNVSREVFDSNVQSVQRVDKRLYLRTMLELIEHSAFDVLKKVRCPTLIVAATGDWVTPPAVARKMAQAIEHSTYREVAGSHFALIEYPEVINRWLRELLLRSQKDEGSSL